MVLTAALLGTVHSLAQKPVEQLLRPAFGSSLLVPALVDTLLENPNQNSVYPSPVVQQAQQIQTTLDTSCVVGEIPYDLRTNLSGQVELIVPIETFASEHKYAPNINLKYTSQSGMTFLGNCWGLEGVSKIELTNKNYFTDGNSDGKNRYDGPWALDGIRVIEESANDSTQTYLTQSDNIKVLRRINGTGFVAYLPDGSVNNYPYSSNYDRFWYIQKNIKNNGQSITFSYYDEGNLKLIKSIEYGDGRTMDFFYEDAETFQNPYTAGYSYTYQKKLSRIDIKQDNNILRQYSLSYRDGKIEAPLSEIAMHDMNHSAVNPLKFHYYGDDASHETETQWGRQLSVSFNIEDPERFISMTGKLNYLSEEDAIIMYPNKVSSYIHNYHQIRNQYNGNETIVVNYGISQEDANPFSKITVGEGFIDAFCMDFDGMPGEELIKVNQTVEGSTEYLKFEVYELNNFGLQKTYTKVLHNTPLIRSGHKSPWPTYFLTGDFTGDGLEEIIIIRSNNPLNESQSPSIQMIDLKRNLLHYSGSIDSFHVNIPGEQYTEN